MVFNPESKKLIRCVYAGDGGTASKPDGCFGNNGQNWNANFCDVGNGKTYDGWCNGAPLSPKNLDIMLALHSRVGSYNEVIVDPKAVENNLPWSIEAIFYIAKGPKAARAEACKAHRDFLLHFPEVNEKYFPLLELNETNWNAPFSRAPRCS